MIDLPDGWNDHPGPDGQTTTHWFVSGRKIIGAISETPNGTCVFTVGLKKGTAATLVEAKQACEQGRQKRFD